MFKQIKTLVAVAAVSAGISAPALAQVELTGGLVQVAPSSVNSNNLTLNGAALPSSVSDIKSPTAHREAETAKAHRG